jgi:hypothetical protein
MAVSARQRWNYTADSYQYVRASETAELKKWLCEALVLEYKQGSHVGKNIKNHIGPLALARVHFTRSVVPLNL